jgi:hypothetical protein
LQLFAARLWRCFFLFVFLGRQRHDLGYDVWVSSFADPQRILRYPF